jgi:hypothetical protein
VLLQDRRLLEQVSKDLREKAAPDASRAQAQAWSDPEEADAEDGADLDGDTFAMDAAAVAAQLQKADGWSSGDPENVEALTDEFEELLEEDLEPEVPRGAARRPQGAASEADWEQDVEEEEEAEPAQPGPGDGSYAQDDLDEETYWRRQLEGGADGLVQAPATYADDEAGEEEEEAGAWSGEPAGEQGWSLAQPDDEREEQTLVGEAELYADPAEAGYEAQEGGFADMDGGGEEYTTTGEETLSRPFEEQLEAYLAAAQSPDAVDDEAVAEPVPVELDAQLDDEDATSDSAAWYGEALTQELAEQNLDEGEPFEERLETYLADPGNTPDQDAGAWYGEAEADEAVPFEAQLEARLADEEEEEAAAEDTPSWADDSGELATDRDIEGLLLRAQLEARLANEGEDTTAYAGAEAGGAPLADELSCSACGTPLEGVLVQRLLELTEVVQSLRAEVRELTRRLDG